MTEVSLPTGVNPSDWHHELTIDSFRDAVVSSCQSRGVPAKMCAVFIKTVRIAGTVEIGTWLVPPGQCEPPAPGYIEVALPYDEPVPASLAANTLMLEYARRRLR